MAVGTTNMAEPGGMQQTAIQKHERAMKSLVFRSKPATTNEERPKIESEDDENESDDTQIDVDTAPSQSYGPSENANRSQDRNRPRNGNRFPGGRYQRVSTRKQQKRDRAAAKEQWLSTLSPQDLALHQAEDRQRRLEVMKRNITRTIRKRCSAKGLESTAISPDDQLQLLRNIAWGLGLDLNRL